MPDPGAEPPTPALMPPPATDTQVGAHAQPPAASPLLTDSRTRVNRRRRKITLRLVIFGIIFVALLAVIIVIALINQNKSATSDLQAQATAWSGQAPGGTSDMQGLLTDNVSTSSNRYTYTLAGTSEMLVGVDVSEHQGNIDWSAVAADGVSFAFIRVGARGYTSGNIIGDSQFEANIKGATAAGVGVGVYFFSQATTADEARAEADYVLTALAGRKLDYPVVYDFETVADSQGRANGLSSVERSINARAFAETIEAAGYPVMIYGNIRDLLMYDQDLRAKYAFWFAEYDVSKPSNYGFKITVWQFGNTGQINGIQGYVDMNVYFTDSDVRRLPDNVLVHALDSGQ